MEALEYKEYHESRMVNNTGSSVVEIEAVLTTVSLGIFVRLWLKFYTYDIHKYSVFLLDFMCIALPVTFQVTVLSSSTYIIPLTMFVFLLCVVLKSFNLLRIRETLSTKIENKRSYITNYRASTNLVSALCILAVDFSIFPRRFAKTEKFGFGLMDLGVGYFICSNGIVTKNFKTGAEFPKILKSSMVLILLGCLRLFTVKSTSYHEHTSEYGVHWNFFFTLGFCKVISYIILVSSPIKEPFLLALLTGLIHHSLLHLGLQSWVFSEITRDSFLSANREGLTSLLGYVSLFFASVSVGQIINTSQNNLTYQKLIMYLLGLCSIMWFFTGIYHTVFGVSRRLANVGYNLWIISSTFTVLLEFVIVDIVISIAQPKFLKKLNNYTQTPNLMECINCNGLVFFLFSNLMTGMINLSFQTFLLSSIAGLVVISNYMVIICGLPFWLHSNNFTLKI